MQHIPLSIRAQAELELRKRRAARTRTLEYTDLRILNKSQQIVPFAPNRAQTEFLKNMTGRDLILKARQLGMSTAVQAHLFRTALTQTARIGTLAHDADTTAKLRDMQQLFYDALDSGKQPPRAVNNATRTYYPQTHSMVYIATAGNKQAGRGGTYSHVHGSEVAFWKDAAATLGGLMQGVPADGEIILESTPNGQQGWFYEQCMKALDGDSTWKLHFFPWWYDDDYRIRGARVDTFTDEETRLMQAHRLDGEQIAWRRAKQRELGMLFPQEYPEDVVSAFLGSGNGYFALSESVFTAVTDAIPIAGRRYVAGLDWGQSADYTVLCVIDTATGEQVDLIRLNREPWESIRTRIVQACLRWNIDVIAAEKNSIGQPNIEQLYNDLIAAGAPTGIQAFVTTNSSKTSVMSSLRMALEEGALRLLPDAIQRHELNAYTASQSSVSGLWTLSAPPGGHDDCVIALALAWYAASGGLFVFAAT